MDAYSFLRNLDDRPPNFPNGHNPLSTLSGLDLDLAAALPTNLRGKGKVAREEAALQTKLVQKFASGDWEPLQPNTGKAIVIGDHHICVMYHEDQETGYRIWEWHGHLLMFDDENGFLPEYTYGNYFQPLEKKREASLSAGLSGIIGEGDKPSKNSSIIHRWGQQR